jgi:hypothetical protein
MPIREVCSPVNKPGGPQGKPQPLPHAPARSRGVQHTAPYGPPATDAGRADVRPFCPQWDRTDPDPTHGDKR